MLRTLRATQTLAHVATRGARQLSTVEKISDNFTFEVTSDGIALITLDMPGVPVNMLSSSLSDDFPKLLNRIETDDAIKAAVLRSGKKGVWVAGADINELAACNTAADAQKLSSDGQAGLATIENCSKPIVAAINGACLGGGLELAMACHYRVASTDSKCKMGLVEVQLGLLPGAGGTQRLQKLVGIQEALKMTTTGGQVKADKAKRTGLVDVVADSHALDHAAHLCALQLANGTLKKSRGKKKSLMNQALEDNPLGRKVLFSQARKMAAKQTGGNYPAVPLIIDCIEKGADSGMAAGLKMEAEHFGTLTQTNASAALIGLFHGTTATKKNPFGKPKAPAKTVGVLGAGLMGAGVAQVSATRGHKVLLKDLNPDAVARGLKQVEDNLNVRVKRRQMVSTVCWPWATRGGGSLCLCVCVCVCGSASHTLSLFAVLSFLLFCFPPAQPFSFLPRIFLRCLDRAFTTETPCWPTSRVWTTMAIGKNISNSATWSLKPCWKKCTSNTKWCKNLKRCCRNTP